MLSCESDFRESFATMGRTQISTDARPSASTSAPGMTRRYPRNKEIIHSGHFMVSEFEAEAQDDEENVAIPVPDESEVKISVRPPPRKAARPSEPSVEIVEPACAMEVAEAAPNRPVMERRNSFTVAIDSSLTKLFQCMSLAYRQKLTSPKWNRFKGLKLRWKDKIRLNNIIWRAWHMQFIKRRSVAVCQFASPLDVDIHIKPEAVVLEGKYWKRKLAAVTAEYKKWRIYFRNNILRKIGQYDDSDLSAIQLDGADWSGGFRCLPGVGLSGGIEHLMDDVDLLMDFNDTLFSTLLPNQPFFFPNPREIAREAGIADFIQPGLVQLQPNLDDFMDTLEPLQDLLNARLPSVPEEVTLPGPSGSSSMTNASSAGPSNSVTIVCPPSDNQQVLYTEMTPLVAGPSSGAGSSDGSLKCGEMTITAVAAGSGKPMTVSYNQLMNVADDGGVVEGPGGPNSIAGQSSSLVYAFVDGKEFTVRTTQGDVAGQVNIDPSTGYPVRVISTTANSGEPTILCNMGHIKHEALSPTSLSPGMPPTAAMSVSPTPSALSPNSCSPSSTSPLGGSGFGGFRPRRTVFSSSQPLGTQAASKNLAFERQQQQMQQQQQAIPIDHDTHQQQTNTGQITSISVPENAGQGGLKNPQDEDVQQTSIPVYHVTPAVPIGAPGDRRHGEVAEPMSEMTFAASTSLPSSGAFGGFVPTKGKHASGPAGFASANAVEWGRQQQQLTHPQQQQHHQQLHHALTRGNQQAQPVGPRHMGRSHQQELPQVANQDAQLPMRNYPASPKATGMGGGRFTPPAGVPAGGPVRGFQPRVAGGSPSHHHANQQQQQQQPFGLRSTAGREFDSGMGAGGLTMGMGNVNAYASPNVNAQTAQPLPSTSVAARKISPGSNVPPFYSAGSPSSLHGGMGSAGLKSPTTPPAVSPPAMPLSHLSGAKRNSDGNVNFEPSGTGYHKDHRRVNHINAEHKRRCNIKNGFDTLQQLVPSLQQQAGGAKVSKAAMLHKAADLIKQLKQERQESQSEVESLKAQIESISRDISVCQSQLPDTGAPVIRHKTSKVTDMYSEYVKQKTLQDWKFWVFSLIANPMAESFSTNVSTGSFEDMCRTTLSWGEQNCSLVTMRPSVLGSLRHLSTNTSILSNPAKLPEEAARAVTKVEPVADGHLTRPGTLSHQSSTSSCSSMS